MSHDEELIVQGRLLTEYAAARRQKVLLQAERDRVGKLIAALGKSIQCDSLTSTPTDEQLAALNREKVIELVDQTKANDAELNQLSGYLKDLGLQQVE